MPLFTDPLRVLLPARHVQAAVLRGQRAPGALALLELLGDLTPPRDG